jgi:Na+/melibiose symporter-like transporter
VTRKSGSTIGGLVFAVGLMLGLLGYVGNVYASSVATILMLGVWLVGGAVARLFADGSREDVAGPERKLSDHR